MQEFQIQRGRHLITLTFSEAQTAPTLEEALVKILNFKRG